LFFWLALQKPKGEESETALFNVSPSYQLDFPPHQPFLQPIVVEEIYMHVAWSFFLFVCAVVCFWSLLPFVLGQQKVVSNWIW